MSQRIIEVLPYQPDWVDAFNTEQTHIIAALSEANVAAVHHIGSTSVPGLAAKPIIDILLEVHDLTRLDDESDAMAALGYLVKGEYGIPGRRYFQKGESQRSHHVHAFQVGSPDIRRHLAFRDYLRHFPDIAQAYGNLKQEGAALCHNDVDVYINHKNAFIVDHEAKALQWEANRN